MNATHADACATRRRVPTLNALAAPPRLPLMTMSLWLATGRQLKHRTTVAGLMPRDCLRIRTQTQDGQTQARVRCTFSLHPLPGGHNLFFRKKQVKRTHPVPVVCWFGWF